MRKLLPLYFVIFIGFLAYSIQIPILTSFVLDPSYGPEVYPNLSLSVKKFILGLLLSMYPLGQFFGSPILGAFSDRVGRRKVLLISLALTISAYFVTSMMVHLNIFPMLYLMLFVVGLFEGNVAIAQGAIVDAVPDRDRSRYFGYIYVCSSTGFIFGPLLASFFSNSDIFSWFVPSTSFWIVTFLLFCTAIWVYSHFRETHTIDQNGKRGFFQEFTNLANVFNDRELRYFYGVNFVIYIAIFGYLRFYPTYVQLTFDTHFSTLSLIIAYVALPFIIVNLFLTPFFSRLKAAKEITLVSSIAMGIAMISIVCFRQFNSIWYTLAITTTALAFANTFSVAMISFMAEKEKQGSVMGNNQSLVAGAQGISSILGGLVAMLATVLPLITFGLLGILAGVMLLRRHHTQWKKDHLPETERMPTVQADFDDDDL